MIASIVYQLELMNLRWQPRSTIELGQDSSQLEAVDYASFLADSKLIHVEIGGDEVILECVKTKVKDGPSVVIRERAMSFTNLIEEIAARLG